MKTAEFFNKFKSRYLWGNLAAMALTIVALAFGAKIGIDIYTHHGESIPVPNLVHQSFEAAENELDNLGLKIVVTDTGYVKRLPAGYILEQSPAPGDRVKSGHIIYVTINSASSPTISLPDIIDNSSLREAMAKLTALGFKLGQPKFIPGEKDWVYGVECNGRSVVAGDKIPVDMPLVILVGNGMRSEDDSVDYIDPASNDTEIFIETGGGEEDEFEEVTAPPVEEPTPPAQPTEEKKEKKEKTEPAKQQPN
ncbi:MAG: PASTA domain-containing protein [Prevotella sp.]|jgi:beta-lactam-binding protein with PASTA domain